jgi:wyosine [tRNA(Phe)-imidazoG37] synthetase (radical SAM superfamily)
LSDAINTNSNIFLSLGLQQFRQCYSGQLAVQTMLLTPWSDRDQADYIARMSALLPDEIQLNISTRPKPRQHQLDARGNQLPASMLCSG